MTAEQIADRLREELRHERDRLRLLLELTNSMTSKLDLRHLVESLSTNLLSVTLPIEGEPADVVAVVAGSADWLASSRVPKLFFRAEPGAILANHEDLAFIRGLPELTEVTVAGRHYVQEDSPDEIGRAIVGWMGASGRKTPRFAKISASS